MLLLNTCQKLVYPPNLANMPNTCHAYRGNVYRYIYHIWSHWHQPYSRAHCAHIWHISLNKNGCHIINIAHMNNMLYGHTDPIFLHIYAKTQPTAIIIYHVIVIYVPEINMSIKLDIYAIYSQDICTYLGDVCPFMWHSWSMSIKTSVMNKVVHTNDRWQLWWLL